MLETEIKRLNDNIVHLNKLLEAMANSAKQDAITPEPTPEVTPEPTPEPVQDSVPEPEADTPEAGNEQGFTVDDIKSMALAISRKDRSKQKDIKAKLVEHDARVAADLKGDGLQAVGEWLTALKDEVGA